MPEGYMSDYTQGRMHGHEVVKNFGLTEAEAMVDYLMSLDNSSIYGLAFARSVSEARIDSLG
jgi:hypothetical protein